MKSRVGAKGQVVIPKPLRERAGLHPGAEVDFEWRDGELILSPRTAEAPLAGRFAGSGMASGLLEDRAVERR